MREIHSHLPAGDMVLKTIAQYLADEPFPFLGIREKATVVVPTEQVCPEAKSFYEGFNYVVGEGKWAHLGFESDSVTTEDLQRFRCYEVVTSYTYHVSVATCAVYSSGAKNILSQLESSINTYRVIPIRLKDKDVDRLLRDVMKKRVQGQPLGRKDLVPLLLATPIPGTMAQEDRIIQNSQLIQESGQLDKEKGAKMLSMLYVLTNKLLNNDDLKEVREMLFMARLGQVLYNNGVADGMMKGSEKGIEAGTRRVN